MPELPAAEAESRVSVEVTCNRSGDGWACDVEVAHSGQTTQHRVAVHAADLEGLDPRTTDPTELVRRSFDFLLEREPPGSILRKFDLVAIGRYFPEYESTIRRFR